MRSSVGEVLSKLRVWGIPGVRDYVSKKTSWWCMARRLKQISALDGNALPARGLKQNGKKIGYVDFVAQNRSGVLAPSLARIVPRIDLGAINAFIDDTPLLTDLQRQFYKTYIAARYEALFK